MSHHGHHAPADASLAASKRSTVEIIRRVWVYLRPYPWLAAGTVGCALVSLAASFAFPKLTQMIIDEIVKGRRVDWLGWAALALAGAFVLRDVFNSLRIRLNNHLEQRVIFDMRRDLFARLQRLPAGYFDKRASGDLMTRVVEDVNSVERILIDGAEQGVVAVLGVVGVAVVLFCYNPTLAAVAMAPLPLLAGGALWYTLTAHKRYRRQREAASALNAHLMDCLQGIRQIKVFGRQPHEDSRFSEHAEALRQGTLGIMRAWANYNPAMSLIAALGSVLVLWLGGRQVLAGTMTVGELVGFLFYLALFFDPLARLHSLNQILQAGRAAGERVFDILDHEPERESGRTDSLPGRLRGEVRYERVSFSYETGRPVLQHITLHVRPGETVALVGPTGAGKSTLVNLMPALYEPEQGRIFIDDCDTRTVTLDSLRGAIAVVSQEPFLFNGTLRENILYGRLDATEAEMVQACKAANCHEFITRLPAGYDSAVGERGVKLSVGEKQRVSIARALLRNAPILLLDEATASVDTATEKLIQEAIERLVSGRTSFVIAHRLSTIRKAHQILVLRHGQIVERGTHESLLEEDGLYAKLARIQNAASIEERFEALGEPS